MIRCTNEGNLDNFLTDLRGIIEMAHALRELADAAVPNSQSSDLLKLESDGFDWIDDGLHKIEIELKAVDQAA